MSHSSKTAATVKVAPASAAAASWVDFELGEDVRDSSRLQQDADWANAVADGRAHVSHRELAMLHAPQVCMAIADYRLVEQMLDATLSCSSNDNNDNRKDCILSCLTPDLLTLIIEFAMPGQCHLVTASLERRKLAILISKTRGHRTVSTAAATALEGDAFPFRICVRKRPMLSFERDFGAYNICDIDSIKSSNNNKSNNNHNNSGGGNVVTLHEGRLARNGRQLQLWQHQFAVDHAFDEHSSNDCVCLDAVEPLLQWALAGSSSTLLCFGQTGTGKTYTLYAALEYISRRLVGCNIAVTFYEVHGKKCYDLLQQRRIVHLRADSSGEMHLRGAKRALLQPAKSPQQLLLLLQQALQLRSTEVTERNPISSRSHAVCCIEILQSNTTVDTAFDCGGGVTVDGTTTATDIPTTTATTDAAAIEATTSTATVAVADKHRQSKPKGQSLAAYLQSQSNKSISTNHNTNSNNSSNTNTSNSSTSGSSTSNSSTSNSNTSGSSTSGSNTSGSSTSNSNCSSSTGGSSSCVGKITLVDLAGSERNYETLKMTAAQHKESADINFALYALKNCFRAFHSKLQADAIATAATITTTRDNNSNSSNSCNSGSDDNNSNNNNNSSNGAAMFAFNESGKLQLMRNGAVAAGSITAAEIATRVEKPFTTDNNTTTVAATADTISAAGRSCGDGDSSSSSDEAGNQQQQRQQSVRIPFRSHLLTRVLKACFTTNNNNRNNNNNNNNNSSSNVGGYKGHRTTVIATVSPTPTDLQHSINTLAHCVLMCPDLHALAHRVSTQLPLAQFNTHHSNDSKSNSSGNSNGNGGSSGSSCSTIDGRKPVHQWSSAEVQSWLARAERGRFAHVVLPPGIDGSKLLLLSANNLSDLFLQQQMNAARNRKEGSAWVESAFTTTTTTATTNSTTVASDAGNNNSSGSNNSNSGSSGSGSGGNNSSSSNSSSGSGGAIGRALWSALRREMQSILARNITSSNGNNNISNSSDDDDDDNGAEEDV